MTGSPHAKSENHFKWVIIGAGPSGCHLAISLLHNDLAKPHEIVLVDPNPPMNCWRKRARNCGMRYLRSTCVHHIGVSTSGLVRFQKRSCVQEKAWKGKFRSPSLNLFDAHCEELLQKYQIRACWRTGKVQRVVPQKQGFKLQTTGGSFTGESVVLALGPSLEPTLPDWLDAARSSSQFLLDHNFDPDEIPANSRLAVIGGGMTAAQAALKLSARHRVKLLTRTQIKYSEFDSPSAWMAPVGPQFLRKNPADRLQVIEKVRRPGTVNTEVRSRLREAINKGLIDHRVLVAPRCRIRGGRLLLSDGRWNTTVDSVLLGMGFQAILHPLKQTIANEFQAPLVSRCYPLLDTHLQWLPNLYVVGCGAETQIGPMATNLLGARVAASRILSRFN